MTKPEVLHSEAMDLAEKAWLEQLRGDFPSAERLYQQAFAKEEEAANTFDSTYGLEPTRSVLFRSAASLALDCNMYRKAEILIARALSGNPSDEIADELRDLLENVYLNRHLDLRGLVLDPKEFQMSIAGEAVGSGVAQHNAFISRVQHLERLIWRTAERKAERPYQEGGRRGLSQEVEVYLSVPRAASFAVSFRIGHPSQMNLPGMGLAEAVIVEMLDCVDLINLGDYDVLRSRIPDVAYRRNFLALTRQIAPDGHSVKTVGFTALSGKKERRVILERQQVDISASAGEDTAKTEEGKRVTVRGTLRFADSTKERKNEIRLIDETGKVRPIRVPKGMMDDIVRPLWDYKVEVVGNKVRDIIHLSDIKKAEEQDNSR